MKNFFKKLAFVLAAALVITTIAPGATAKAAAKKNPGLAYAGKILYLGGDYTGKYEDTYTFKFKDTWGLKATWKALNPEIADMSDEKNTVVAVAPGTAKFSVTLKDAKGKVVKTQTATVWVRQNADEVGFGSQKAIEAPRAVGDTFRIFAYRALDGKKVWATKDYSEITDKIVWSSSNEKVATVTEDYGTVKCVGAGEATITATVVQSNGVVTDISDSYKVEVKAGLVSAKLISSTKAELTFGAPVSADDVKALVMKNAAGTNISTYIKSVTLNADKTVATVESYVAFADKDVYTFSIEALKTSIEMPVSIGTAAAVKILAPSVAVINKATDIKYQVLDANGIIIAENDGNVTLSLSDYTYSYLNTSDKKITMYKTGEKTTLKLVYKTGKYDANWNEITFEDTADIICVEEAPLSITGDVQYCVEYNKIESKDADYASGLKTVALESDNYYLNVKGIDANKDVIVDFTYESKDPTKLFVNPSTGALVPIATGAVPVLVTKDKFSTIVMVTVVPKATASSIEMKVSGTTILSNSDSANESVTATLTVKNQYGQKLAPATVEVTKVTGPKNSGELAYNTNNKGKVTFYAANAVKGSYTYKLKMSGKVCYITVTVNEPADAVAAYKVLVSNNTIDTVVDKDSSVEDFQTTFKVVSIDANGVTIDVVDSEDLKELTVKKGDTKVYELNKATSGSAVTVSGSAFTFSAVAKSASSAAIQLDGTNYKKIANGDYVISGKVKDGNVERVIGGATIVVKNTQTAASVSTTAATLELPLYSSVDTLKAKVTALVKLPKDTDTIKYVPGSVTAEIDTDYTATSGKGTYHAVIKKVTYTEKLGENLVNCDVTVNKIITITVK